MLLLEANHAVSADRLIDALWGDHPPDTAKNTLQVYVSQLRKLLPEGALETVSPGYRLAVAPEALDLSRFEELAQQGRAALGIGDAATAAQALGAALALWRGPALADLAWEPFAQAEAARLEELRLAALEDRIEADLALGRHGPPVAQLEHPNGQNPLRARLALELARRLAPEFRDGSRMAELGTIHDPALVPRAILQALDLPDAAQDPEEALLKALAGAELFLLVDNFEQVLDAAPTIARLVE